jgi:hypothetical protein
LPQIRQATIFSFLAHFIFVNLFHEMSVPEIWKEADKFSSNTGVLSRNYTRFPEKIQPD